MEKITETAPETAEKLVSIRKSKTGLANDLAAFKRGIDQSILRGNQFAYHFPRIEKDIPPADMTYLRELLDEITDKFDEIFQIPSVEIFYKERGRIS